MLLIATAGFGRWQARRALCSRTQRVPSPVAVRRGSIDVIGGKWLTEINVTSPTGIVAIDQFNGTDTAGLIWDAIKRRHAEL